MMKQTEGNIWDLPIITLPEGEVFPNKLSEHSSWTLCEGWDDPVAPWDGMVRAPQKQKVVEGCSNWLEFNAKGLVHDADRALILKFDDWESVQIEAVCESLEETVGTTLDDATPRESRVGLVFAQQTVRHYHLFCIEGRRTLALYRRVDNVWTLLHRQDYDDLLPKVRLTVKLSGDSLLAQCDDQMFKYECDWEQPLTGKVGYRSLGWSKLHSLTCRGSLRSVEGIARNNSSRLGQFREKALPRIELPTDCIVRGTFILEGHGQSVLLCWQDSRLFAQDWDGRILWQLEGTFLPSCIRFSQDQRKIYAMSADRWSDGRKKPDGTTLPDSTPDRLKVIDATSGTLVGELILPEDPDLESDIVNLPNAEGAEWDIGAERGMASQKGGIDFVLKRDFWDGWRTIWAYDGGQKLLWRRRTRLPYGHHYAVRVADLDGDGELEVLAGGTAFRQDGSLWWEHDQGSDLIRTIGGGHYDAVWLTNDPVTGKVARVLLLSGSAGIFVLDPLTGKTLNHIHNGHAQVGMKARLFPKHYSEQCIVLTRWGNPGILTGLDSMGQRLWTTQPDYIGQGSLKVRVKERPYDLLWVNTSRASLGLYDSDGEYVAALPGISKLWGERTRKGLHTMTLESCPNSGPDILAVQIGHDLHCFQVEECV